MHKLAIIQARMSSSRLPGKVMREISGKPMLQFMLERVRKAKLIDGVLLATTTDPADDVLEQFSQKLGLPCYRGSVHDVLDRFYQAATYFDADVIVRLTADCPLIDPELIDMTIHVYLGKPVSQSNDSSSATQIDGSAGNSHLDFAANRLPPPWKRTLPIGLDVEVCSLSTLERAWKEAVERYQREHVMPYLYEGITFPKTHPVPDTGWYIEQGLSPRGFTLAILNHVPDYGSLRWSVDTAADLEFVRQIAGHFRGQPGFGWSDVIRLLEEKPELAAINAGVKHKSAYDVDQRAPDH